jgi:DNA-nicking Smr family endonuclease
VRRRTAGRDDAPSEKSSPDKRDPVEDDEFARAMEGVRRLPEKSKANRVPPGRPVEHPSASSSPPSGADVEQGEEDLSWFLADGVNHRALRPLRRGDHRPGDTLDVHGMTATEAVVAVRRFVEQSRGRHRCIAIVHGRGLHSADGVPVLKTRVRAFLRSHPAVLAFADAPSRAGGGGAVHVLLKK